MEVLSIHDPCFPFPFTSSKQRELSQQDLAALSVKERVNQLEQSKSLTSSVSKPKKKRPSNKAFQEFERRGILISFVSPSKLSLYVTSRGTVLQGQVPKKQSEEELQDNDDAIEDHHEEEEEEQMDLPIHMNEGSASYQQKTPMQQTIQQEDLVAVTRETELLKSVSWPVMGFALQGIAFFSLVPKTTSSQESKQSQANWAFTRASRQSSGEWEKGGLCLE
jgi:hypothetical protein